MAEGCAPYIALGGDREQVTLPSGRAQGSQTFVFLLLAAALCVLGCANDLCFKIAANIFTQRFAFFVDQGNNVLYTMGSAIPAAWLWWRSRIPSDTWKCPQRKYAIMGLLDALGTFFSSTGAVHTPGQLQIVLAQALIPISMVASVALLGCKYTRMEVGSAGVVLFGAGIAVAPELFGMNGSARLPKVAPWPPMIFMYFLSNIPMALSNVYKELGFSSLQLDVWCLTTIVTMYQTAISFFFLGLQTLPYFSGRSHGVTFSEAWRQFVGGAQCSLGSPPAGHNDIDCRFAGPLLFLYVAANLSFNVVGLALVKAGSGLGVGSVLCSLAFAFKLPISAALFSSAAVMGRQAEPFHVITLAGVVFVVGGFLLHVEAGRKRATAEEELLKADRVGRFHSCESKLEEPWAFHERLVGCVSTKVVRPAT